MRSKIVLLVTTVVCFMIQSTVLHLISIGSITPNLLLILCFMDLYLVSMH